MPNTSLYRGVAFFCAFLFSALMGSLLVVTLMPAEDLAAESALAPPSPVPSATEFVLQEGIVCQIPGDTGILPCHANLLADLMPIQSRSTLTAVACTDGLAGEYPCHQVDLTAFIPITTFASGQLNDLWGWTDPESGSEIVILGARQGTLFIDISDPTNPVYLAELARTPAASDSYWKDIKVYQNTAYVVADYAGDFGLQIFDLTRLRDVVTGPVTLSPDNLYTDIGSAHNLMINEESGFLYILGTSSGQERCSGGMHILDLKPNPLNPTFAGCVSDDGYVHDSQCVLYQGPDEAYQGGEICFNFNEDDLVIVDVTQKSSPIQLSKVTYDGAVYTHQGWVTPDHRYLLLDDEFDERNSGNPTKTFVWDLRDLDQPVQIGTYVAETNAADHNQYERWGYSFQANYQAGLRILDLQQIEAGELAEVAYFDIFPDGDHPNYNGAWSSYPYFESGIVPVSGIESGLYLLRPTGLSRSRVKLEPSRLRSLPGERVLHTFELLMLGDEDSYSILLNEGAWPTTLQSDFVLTGGAFERQLITVSVDTPSTLDATDLFSLTVIPFKNPEASVSVSGQTTVTVAPDFSIELEADPAPALITDTLTSRFTIQNTGPAVDRFEITLLNSSWDSQLSMTRTAPLLQSERETILITQAVGDGVSNRIDLRISSLLDQSISQTLSLTASLSVSPSLILIDPLKGLLPNRTLYQQVGVINHGNISDTYTVQAESDLLQVTPVEDIQNGVEPGNDFRLMLFTIAPSDVHSDTITFSVTSARSGETISRTLTLQNYSHFLPMSFNN